MPRLVAHRGHAQRFPENSLSGIRDALHCGADDIEVDIQLTRDGVPVLYHDASLARVSGVSGSILDLTAAEAYPLPAGESARFADRFAEVRITPLTAVCTILEEHPDATLFAEIKEESLLHHDRETLVDATLAALAPIREQVTVISYDADVLRCVRTRKRAIGYVLRRYDEDHAAKLRDLAPDIAIVNHTKITGELWSGSWQWMCYEVTDANTAHDLVGRGVTYLETMAVADLRAALRASD